MNRLIKNLVALLFRAILSTRYKIKTSGSVPLSTLKGTLILPNHPAEIDPVIISTQIWSFAAPRPVVLETIYKMPLINSIFRYIGAIPMPDMEQGSGFYKRRRIRKTLKEIADKLQAGSNVIFYPSGRLSMTGREQVGGASGTFAILQQMDTGNLLLVRSRGLWGSRFSKACTAGKRPDIGLAVLSSVSVILRNLFFLVPKRQVSLHFEEFSLQDLKKETLPELNCFLENWYNSEPAEKLSCIADSFLGGKAQTPQIAERQQQPEVQLAPHERSKILDYLGKISGRGSQDIKSDLLLSEDLGLDSLTLAELITWLTEEYECGDIQLSDLSDVNSVFAILHRPQLPASAAQTPANWLQARQDNRAARLPEAKSLAEAFLRRAKTCHNMIACSDSVLGIRKYSDLLTAAIFFRQQIAKLDGKYIGVIMPASASSIITIFSILLAGKIPVFLNWTAGKKSIRYAVDLLSIKAIISAGAVLDSIDQDLSDFEDLFVLLDELRNKASGKSALQAWLIARLPLALLTKKYCTTARQPAAVLFTSGSESRPKAVPLSDANILANISSICKVFNFKDSDVFYGFLPPFHSFGLTVTSLLPILCGIRVVFSPNPNESRKLAQGCRTWQVNALAGTPSFIKGILSAADQQCFQSLKLIMSGADRLGQELRNLCQQKAPEAQLLEGYGITECAPVVCAQRKDQPGTGVGPALPGVEIKIMDINLEKQAGPREQGLILISGPNVFDGYLGDANDPFVHIDGKKWYNSGDLGYLDDAGSLVLSGRLRRFVKIGGEMISLPAIEEFLLKSFGKNSSTALLCIIEKQLVDSLKPELIIFSNIEGLTCETVQSELKNAGFPALIRFSQAIYLDELPLLGSGKIDIQALKKRA